MIGKKVLIIVLIVDSAIFTVKCIGQEIYFTLTLPAVFPMSFHCKCNCFRHYNILNNLNFP